MIDFEYIKSKDNQNIKLIAKLQTSSSVRYKHGLFVIEGLRLCRDAVENGFSVEQLIVTECAYNQFSDDIERIAENSKRNILIDNELFSKISDTKSPQGVLCVCRMLDIEYDVRKIRFGKFVVLENIQDPANLGAVVRTAEALGISGIIVDSKCCDPYSPKVQRAGMGALLRLPVFVSENFYDDLEALKENGFKLYASVPKRYANSISEIDFTGKCAVLIGNEGNGLTEKGIGICDKMITIPMNGKAESLNAATAASIIMWEMVK